MEDFQTRSLGLAAYLNLEGISHDRTEVIETRKGRAFVVWVFLDGDRLRECLANYESGKARVDPRAFIEEHGSLRTGMFELMDEHRGSGN